MEDASALNKAATWDGGPSQGNIADGWQGGLEELIIDDSLVEWQNAEVDSLDVSEQPLSPPCSINRKVYECNDCGLLTTSNEVLVVHRGQEGHSNPRLPALHCPASSCPNIFHSLQACKVHLESDHHVSSNEIDLILSLILDKCRPLPLSSSSANEIKEKISNEKKSSKDARQSQRFLGDSVVSSDSAPPRDSDATPGVPSASWNTRLPQDTLAQGSDHETQGDDVMASSSDDSEIFSDSDQETSLADNSLDLTESIKKHISVMNLMKKQKLTAHRCLMTVKCRLRFKSLNTLDYHKKCHDLAKKCWKCPECSNSFSVWNSLALHLWNVHSIDMELYFCNLCSFRTPNLSQLKTNHMWIHSGVRSFTCSLCSKSVKTRKQLRNHQAIHKKTGRGRYECKSCRALFSRRSLLRQHHLAVHQNARNYRCSLCPHRSATRSAHDLHFRKHTKEKKYACGECSYTTGDHNALRRHLATHSGHRPYSCPHCSYTSIHSTSLRAHLNSKHPGMLSDVVFSCPLCPFSSLRKDLFVSHTASKHSVHSPLLTTVSQAQEGGCNSGSGGATD